MAAGRGQGGAVTRADTRRRFWRRFFRNRRAAAGLAVLVVFTLMMALASTLAPYPAEKQILVERLSPPGPRHWMGTDGLGRDVLSRAVFASRVSLPIGLFSMLVSVSVGASIGTLAGFLGGTADNVLMRLTDLILSFPVIFLLLTMTTIFGRSVGILILLIGLTSWGSTARVVRGQVLVLRESGYVEAARMLGASSLRIMLRHILPNTVPTVVVGATLRIALGILIEGGLSFLGLGVQAPTPSWGNMIAEGRKFLRVAWWISVFPGVFLFLCVMSINLVGDGLRDAVDPWLTNR
jgi:peptide/nickel transport system permease protein